MLSAEILVEGVKFWVPVNVVCSGVPFGVMLVLINEVEETPTDVVGITVVLEGSMPVVELEVTIGSASDWCVPTISSRFSWGGDRPFLRFCLLSSE